MTDDENINATAQETAPQQTVPEPTPAVKPDVITPLVSNETIENLTKSINELQQMQKAIYEQQKFNDLKGVDDGEEKLKY